MAMRSMFRMRKVVNLLLKEKKIDENTIIHIEFSRYLNDNNKRKAILNEQKRNEKERNEYRQKIEEMYQEKGIRRNPSDTDILKYQLWEEQDHKCLYTGKEICLTDFLGDNPQYDIEHTLPRSAGGDSTRMNLTLCSSVFNRDQKKTLLPCQLPDHEAILQRISCWKETYEDLNQRIRKLKRPHCSTKEQKDSLIQRRHELEIQRDYWRGKYQRFIMEKVPEGFSRRQGTDISVISRYARLYLKSVFPRVYTVKGIATSDFRKIWGIQEEYEKKQRDNHAHHCIDAITIACIGPNEYGQLAKYYHELEEYEFGRGKRPQFPAPWPTFVQDIKHIQDDLLVTHYTPDNMPKADKRRIMTPQGKIMAQGDSARGSLHCISHYGAIEREGQIKYVTRAELSGFKEKYIVNIVDDEVRSKVEQAVKEYGTLAKAVAADGIWMNKEKGIRIKKVRYFNSVQKGVLDICTNRDRSRHEYKQKVHVLNDKNYMIAIYEGTDEKGRIKREYEEVNNMAAAAYYRASNKTFAAEYDLIPKCSREHGYPLCYRLKTGTMVFLYEKTPEEVWELDRQELLKRLYKITILSLSDGRITLMYHQEARNSSDVPQKDGAFHINEDFRPKIRVSLNQFKALVEGVDFKLNELGEIKRLR
ncbi:MAG: hypothetical protein LUC45_04130 [Paraprevotella sp.]|nr:hypothetical protein [Paraprevotella sp.]